ncbi:hypothetical protein GCM10011390_39250 [Aureimonas endophytica]|uniref:Uncharacterized protein n=1 Tax=Aureimonas endophytica TaxID=2027858 RepID=A0A917EB18_9HYPH|nr:hypothetical protein GCM10011390_39250 [Aureimonas endophytica]
MRQPVRAVPAPAIQSKVREVMRHCTVHRVDTAMPDQLAELLRRLDVVTDTDDGPGDAAKRTANGTARN